MNLQYALLNDSSWQHLTKWQTPDTPFMSFEFWQALSDTGAIGEKAGWLPIYILIHRSNDMANDVTEEALSSAKLSSSKLSTEQIGQPMAVMPVFIKGHHQG
ncbi:MAG: N-acetyltransferase, partial [Psychrobacter sp.]|nr:N-acetyltransferase [Psychrobacter sp.]